MRGLQEKRFLVDRDAEAKILEFVQKVRDASRCDLTMSHIVRAAFKALLSCTNEIVNELESDECGLKRPVNGNTESTTQFENHLAGMFSKGIVAKNRESE